MQEPYDIEKLRSWLEVHSPVDGKINGEPIIKDTLTELKGYVNERDYNDALRLAAPWAGKKAFIADHGIVSVLSRSPILTHEEMKNLRTYTKGERGARLFRGRISQGTLDLLDAELAPLSLNRSQVATIVLRYFISSNTIQRVYTTWLRSMIAQTGLKYDQLEEIIYDYYRVDGASKRLEKLEAGDPDGLEEKQP